MNKRMSYSEVYDIIAIYANDLLPMYADFWSRFPVSTIALKIANGLKNKAITYEKINPEIAAKINNVVNEILLHVED